MNEMQVTEALLRAILELIEKCEATDWNYVRFDCACFMYELVNGELRFYCC